MSLGETTEQAITQEILPDTCCQCENIIGPSCRSVLQLCSCRVVFCLSCALGRLSLNDGYGIDCLVCGNVVNEQTGVLRNLDKVKTTVDAYIKRSYEFFQVQPPDKLRSVTKFHPLLVAFLRDEGYKKFVEEIKAQIFGGNDEIEKVKPTSMIGINHIKLQIARLERLRGGPLEDPDVIEAESTSAFLNAGEEDCEEDEEKMLKDHHLPYGPLHFLRLSRNIMLEKLLMKEELDVSCVVCREPLKPNGSTQFACDCLVMVCRSCLYNQILHKQHTYHRGLFCVICKEWSNTNFGNIEAVRQKESELATAAAKFIEERTGKRFLIKSALGLQGLCEEFWLNGFAPSEYSLNLEDMGIFQLRLEAARLFCYVKWKQFEEEGSPVEDECFKMDPDYKLPLGPLKLLTIHTNPYFELYVKYSEIKTEEDAGTVDWSKYRFPDRDVAIQMTKFSSTTKVTLQSEPDLSPDRFERFKPEMHSFCPICNFNPRNKEYLKTHLLVFHKVADQEQLEDWMAKAVILPVSEKRVNTSMLPSSTVLSEDVPVVRDETIVEISSDGFIPSSSARVEPMSNLEEGEIETENKLQPLPSETEVPNSSNNPKSEEIFARKQLLQYCKEFSNSLYGRFKRVLNWQDNYEVIFQQQSIKEGLSSSDPAILGNFVLKFHIILGEKDSQQQLYDPESPILDSDKYRTSGDGEGEQYQGFVDIFSNKLILSCFKSFLATQLQFNGMIVKFANQRGRVLQGTRSFSYYHIREGTEVTVRPYKPETAPRRQIKFHRKHINRKTPLELAKEYVAKMNREKEYRSFGSGTYDNGYSYDKRSRPLHRTDEILHDTDDDSDDSPKHDRSSSLEPGCTWYVSRNKDLNPQPSTLSSYDRRKDYAPTVVPMRYTTLDEIKASREQSQPKERKQYDAYETAILDGSDDSDSPKKKKKKDNHSFGYGSNSSWRNNNRPLNVRSGFDKSTWRERGGAESSSVHRSQPSYSSHNRDYSNNNHNNGNSSNSGNRSRSRSEYGNRRWDSDSRSQTSNNHRGWDSSSAERQWRR